MHAHCHTCTHPAHFALSPCVSFGQSPSNTSTGRDQPSLKLGGLQRNVATIPGWDVDDIRADDSALQYTLSRTRTEGPPRGGMGSCADQADTVHRENLASVNPVLYHDVSWCNGLVHSIVRVEMESRKGRGCPQNWRMGSTVPVSVVDSVVWVWYFYLFRLSHECVLCYRPSSRLTVGQKPASLRCVSTTVCTLNR